MQVPRGARVRVDGGRVRLGDGCLLGPGCRIEAPGGTVEIGAGARLGERSVIVARRRWRSARAPWSATGRRSPTPSRPARTSSARRAAAAAAARRSRSATARGSARTRRWGRARGRAAGAAVGPTPVVRDARRAPLVDRGRLARDVGPVEAQHVLARLGDEPVAQRVVGQQLLGHPPSDARSPGAEAQPDAAGRAGRPRAARRCRRRCTGSREAIASSATSPNGS